MQIRKLNKENLKTSKPSFGRINSWNKFYQKKKLTTSVSCFMEWDWSKKRLWTIFWPTFWTDQWRQTKPHFHWNVEQLWTDSFHLFDKLNNSPTRLLRTCLKSLILFVIAVIRNNCENLYNQVIIWDQISFILLLSQIIFYYCRCYNQVSLYIKKNFNCSEEAFYLHHSHVLTNWLVAFWPLIVLLIQMILHKKTDKIALKQNPIAIINFVMLKVT